MSVLERFSRSYKLASTFVSRAYSALEQFREDELRLRTGDGCKRLVEEVLPIAASLKYFEIPGREIKCRFFPGNQNYDARMIISADDVRLGPSRKTLFH